MNRTEAIIISAAVAVAFVPRFEARVQNYVQTHRTEIQMAMNELQGKPAVPFAASDADAPTTQEQDTQLALMSDDQAQMASDLARARAEIAQKRTMTRTVAHAAARAQMANATLQRFAPQMAQLRTIAMKNRTLVNVYRWKAQRCPLPPAPEAPAIPQPVHVVISSGM